MKKFEIGGIISENRKNDVVLDNQEFVVSTKKENGIKSTFTYYPNNEMLYYLTISKFLSDLANDKLSYAQK